MIEPNYIYRAISARVVDGDTLDCDVDVGFHLTARLRLRLNRINTYELTAKDPAIRALALEGASLTGSVVPPGTACVIQTTKADAFGRYLAEVWYVDASGAQVNLNDRLLASGLAVLYKR